MKTTRVSRFLIKSSMAAVVLAMVHQFSPGEKYWMTRPSLESYLHDPPMPPIGDEGPSWSLHEFMGGDQTTKLRGKLYLPKPEEQSMGSPPPVVVLAHGLGLTQDAKLDNYIKAFTAAGMASFTLDYATFGWSDGWPRHQVKPQSHIQDIRAALSYIQNELPPDLIDGTRIGLWGTSLGGGHVLSLAADESIYLERTATNRSQGKRSYVKAVVAQVPHLKSGLESVIGTIQRDPVAGLSGLCQVTLGLFKGAVSYITTGEPMYLPLSGKPGSAAMMQNPGDEKGYGKLNEHVWTATSTWQNLATIGSVIQVLLYRPMSIVERVDVPTLFVTASNDSLCPAADSAAAAAKLKALHPARAIELFELKDASHFDIYDEGTRLDEILSRTVSFLQRHL